MIFANFMEDLLRRLHFTFSINSHKFIQVDRNITISKFFYSGQQIVLIKIHLSNFLFSVGLCNFFSLVDGSKRVAANNKGIAAIWGLTEKFSAFYLYCSSVSG